MAEEATYPQRFGPVRVRIVSPKYETRCKGEPVRIAAEIYGGHGGSNPVEVDLIFDHNCHIRVREGTARRRPLHRGQRHLQGPNRSKQARTQQQQGMVDANKFFLVAIVRQSSRIESLKTTSGGLGHFFKLGACRLGGW